MAESLDPLEPQTDGTFTVTVEVAGVLRDDATVTASVYNPRGVLVANAIALTPVGSSTGKYNLAWLGTWTESSGRAIPGEYLVEVITNRIGVRRTRRFRQPIQFTDTE